MSGPPYLENEVSFFAMSPIQLAEWRSRVEVALGEIVAKREWLHSYQAEGTLKALEAASTEGAAGQGQGGVQGAQGAQGAQGVQGVQGAPMGEVSGICPHTLGSRTVHMILRRSQECDEAEKALRSLLQCLDSIAAVRAFNKERGWQGPVYP